MAGIEWSSLLGWTLLVTLAYPILTLFVAEWSRRTSRERTDLLRALRFVQALLLPMAAIWLIVDQIAGLDPTSLPVKLIDTAFGIAVLATLLTIAQGALTSITARSNVPRLFYDIALTLLVVIGSAVIISTVWGFSLTGLLSAVGVGSVVMGLALQGVIGGMVSGVLLLSARQFKIGDWLRTGSHSGRVVQIDWRSVTLEVSSTERLILPSASLSSSAFSVAGAAQPGNTTVSVTLGYQHSPERARMMLLEAARGVPQLISPERASCGIVEYGANGIVYSVSVTVGTPSEIGAARNELLSRIWYASQRNGMSLAPPLLDKDGSNNLLTIGRTAEERAELLAATGIFRRPMAALMDLAEAAQLQHWRAGEVICQQGVKSETVLVVLHGQIRVCVQVGATRVELESLGEDQVFVTREAFRGGMSPVTVLVAEEAELLSIPARALQRLLDMDHKLASELETILDTHSLALGNVSSLATTPHSMAV